MMGKRPKEKLSIGTKSMSRAIFIGTLVGLGIVLAIVILVNGIQNGNGFEALVLDTGASILFWTLWNNKGP